MNRRISTVVGSFLALAACSSSPNDTTTGTAVTTAVESTTTAVAASESTSTTTTTPESALLSDSRLSPISALANPNECKIADITPSDKQPELTSGFPRSELGADPLEDLKLLVVPVSVSDSVFDDSDVVIVQEMLDFATKFYEHQSYGKVTINATIAPRESWVTLPGTADSTGMTDLTPLDDKTQIYLDALMASANTLDLAAFDMVAVYTHKDDRFYFGQAFESVDTPDGPVPTGVLIGGKTVTLWTVLAHEIGHSWLLSEDLYYFPDQSQIMMGGWDLMAQPIAITIELSPWLRWINGWLSDDQVRCITAPGETVHFLETISKPSNLTKMSVVKLSDHSALVVDSRRQGEFGVDGYDSNGDATIVYVVDTSIAHGQGPIRWRGELRTVGDSLTTDGVTITLLEADDTSDLVSIVVG